MFLEIKNIKKHFGEGESRVEVLKGIDIEIEKGEFCVLLGPSGSGKSTLLNIIGGIDAADEGYISINGEKTADMNEKALTLLTLTTCLKPLGFTSIVTSFLISFREVSSRELLLAEPSSRTLISCSATSLQVRLTTIPPRRYCSL